MGGFFLCQPMDEMSEFHYFVTFTNFLNETKTSEKQKVIHTVFHSLWKTRWKTPRSSP